MNMSDAENKDEKKGEEAKKKKPKAFSQRLLRNRSLTPNSTRPKTAPENFKQKHDKKTIGINDNEVIEEANRDFLHRHKESKIQELIRSEESYLEDLSKIQSFFLVNMKKSKQDPEYPVPM